MTRRVGVAASVAEIERPGCRPGVRAVPAAIVERPRVADALRGPSPLVVIHAPNGYGKTTVVAHWAHEVAARGHEVVWVSASQNGDACVSPEQLRARMVEGLAEVTGSSDVPPAIVVDGVQAGHAHLIDVAWSFGVESGVRVVVLSTVPRDPGCRLPRGAAELGPAALMWSAEDVVTHAKAWGLDLSDEEGRAVADGLAGWPASIVAALAELAEAGLGSITSPGELLAVVRRRRSWALTTALPRDVMIFLLEMCAEPTFDGARLGELAVAEPVEIARQLVDAGVLYRHEGQRSVLYEWDPRVRMSLVEHSRHLDPTGFAARTERLAVARIEAGDVRGALLRACESGSAGVVDLVVGSVWPALLRGPEACSLDEAWGLVLRMLPDSVPWRLRMLHLTAHARVLPVDGPIKDDGTSPDSSTSDGLAWLLDAFVRCALLRRSGQPEDALQFGRAVLADAPRWPTNASADQLSLARALVELQMALSALHAGLLRGAADLADAAFHRATASGALAVCAAAGELAAVIAAMSADVESSRRWMAEVDGLPDPPSWWRSCAGPVDRLVSACWHLEQCRPDQAMTELDAIGDIGEDLWLVGTHLLAGLAEAGGAPQPAIDAITMELDRRGLMIGRPGGGPHPPIRVTADLARLHAVAGRGIGALQMTGRLPSSCSAREILSAFLDSVGGAPEEGLSRAVRLSERGRLAAGMRIASMAVAASALLQSGDKARALEELKRAHAIATRVGAVFVLRWASREALELLLGELSPRDASMLAPLVGLVKRRPEGGLLLLPERLLLVLQRLVAGLNGPEIARELFVSKNTVKTQIQEIYRRLDAHSRADLVVRAAGLGLMVERRPS